jgi:[acyl-carrier-protein] S-malonyltransferase
MKTAWLFPGQGSQFCGMGRDLWFGFEPARDVLRLAERLSGLKLGQYSLQGPAETLTRTDVLQPAITAMSIGCALLMESCGHRPDMVAGHSLGEFSALFAAGVLTTENTLRLVIERGRLMQRAAEQSRGGMLAIKGIDSSRIESLVELSGLTDVCSANYNSPEQTTVSGPVDALRAFTTIVASAGGESVELPVAGAWHSRAMESAAQSFADVLNSLPFNNARCPVYVNLTAAPEVDGERLRDISKRHMTSPVRWRQSIEKMMQHGASDFLEVGPGKVLRGLLRRICAAEGYYSVRGIEGPRTLSFLRPAALGQTT